MILKKKVMLKRDAIFRIASQTKAITSVAIMMLYEEGKLLLNDPVSHYIPEFKNQRYWINSMKRIPLIQPFPPKEILPSTTCLPILPVSAMRK